MLREINIHKINKVVQNKVEKQEKRYFKIVSPNLHNKEKSDNNIKIDKEVKKTLNEEKNNNNNLKTEEEIKKPPIEENKNNNHNPKTEEEAKNPPIEENKSNNSKSNEEIKKPQKEEDKNKSNEEMTKKLNEEDKTYNKQHLGQISAKAHAPSQIKGGLPPMQKKNEIIINKNKYNRFPITKKKYHEDKRIPKDEQNEEEPEKDLFEEELRKAALKNSAINAFRGTVIKKGDDPEKEINYNNKITNDNNNLKDNNASPLKEKKPKIQPPKQVLEFNAKKENILNNSISNGNINEISVKNQSQKDIKSSAKTKGRKISRYYYRKDENNREVRKAMAHNKEKILNRKNINEINLPSNNNNNTENNSIYSHRNLRNKRREIIQTKLNNLIKKIDSHSINISFKKWKNLDKNKNNSLNSELKKNENEKINPNNSKAEDNKDKELLNKNKILDNIKKENENEEKKNNIKIDNKISDNNKDQDEKSQKYDKNNIHDIIKNATENNFKILNKNIEYIKKENQNNSFDCEIYLSLLIKNCKRMAVYRIFCLYNLFNQNLNYYIKRNSFNKWKKNIANIAIKNENNSNINNNTNNSYDKK